MFTNPLSKPNAEAVKEILRLAIFYAVSWVITQTLLQLTAVPQSLDVKMWVFTYAIPIRFILEMSLTLLARYLDKFMYINDKENKEHGFTPNEEKPKGILPF